MATSNAGANEMGANEMGANEMRANEMGADDMVFTTVTERPYYNLFIYAPGELRDIYKNAAKNHNESVSPCIFDSCEGRIPTDFNAGFDLFCPKEIIVGKNNWSVKVNHEIVCAMRRVEPGNLRIVMNSSGEATITPSGAKNYPVGYYLYPRSSTGTKTPLRLSNSVGIIDSGYRGSIIAVFDNATNIDFIIQQNTRLMQICPPDLCHPIYVSIVDSLEGLGITQRGSGGFGSTGTGI